MMLRRIGSPKMSPSSDVSSESRMRRESSCLGFFRGDPTTAALVKIGGLRDSRRFTAHDMCVLQSTPHHPLSSARY